MVSIAVPLGPTEVSRHAALARRLGLFSFPLAAMATLFHRLGLADTAAALVALGLAFTLAAIALAFGAYALIRIWIHGYAGGAAAAIGTVWGLATLAPAIALAPYLAVYPLLNQVSTDLVDPPAFVWADRARIAQRLAPVPAITPAARAAQEAAYPRLVSMRIDLPAPEAFQLIGQMMERRRWSVLDRRPPQARTPGRIEATARTALFGFPDDVVVRITPLGQESRIDMRSASRFGAHDFGSNAQRVTAFMTELRDRALER